MVTTRNTSALQLQKNRNQLSRQERLEKAEEISDELEFSLSQFEEKTYQEILQAVITVFSQENDYEIQEVLLNSLANALSERECIAGLDLLPLIERINLLKKDCLLHTLDIIGLSRNIAHIELIKPFLFHSSLEVRETAKIALAELVNRKLPINGN